MEFKIMPTVHLTFEPDGRRIIAQPGERIMEIAKRVGIQLRSGCGGQGFCGKCRVRIVPATGIKSLTSDEKAHLTTSQLTAGFRLACQAVVNGNEDMIVTIPTVTRGLRRRVQLEGNLLPIRLNPAIQSVLLRVSGVDPDQSIPDTERVLASLSSNHKFKSTTRWDYPLHVISKTPEMVRKARGEVTVVLRNRRQLLDIHAGDARESVFGVALDIGTSKIVGSLYSLVSGTRITSHGIENPQLRFGEDIISRLSYARASTETAKELQNAVIEGINLILSEFSSQAAQISRIYEVIVVGNTVMTSLLLGIDTTHLSYGPFIPPFRGPVEVSAGQLGLELPPQSVIYVLPNIAGYVGADAIANILTTRLNKKRKPCLVIDIGTNSEVLLGNRDRISATSCAAGPAFEGGQITHGMKAVSGAIERVSLNPTTMEFALTTINDAKPIGICGSGVVDAIAQLAQAKLISNKGRFTKKAEPNLNTEGKNKSITLFKGASAKDSSPITLSEQDISQLLLAKAAIQTGYSLLLQHQQLTPNDLDHVYIAGAFGTYLNSQSAQQIGLIPPVPLEKVSFIGNAALSGAQLALLSMPQRRQASRLAKTVEFVDLARHSDFSKTYASSLFL